MDLKELATMYRDSGEKCRIRLSEMENKLASQPMSNTERYRLRREVCLLSGMARDAIAIANYLEHYYERKSVYDRRKPSDTGIGVSSATAVYQAGRFL